MKKLLYCLLGCIILTITAAAQDNSLFGYISQEELDLKECSFEKDANAVVLLDEAVSNYDDNYHLITNRHIRIKILKEKGFNAADVEIYFYRKDDFESIYQVEALITNIDAEGKMVQEKLNSKSFYKKNENERLGKMIFTFPNVKVGSIIEYKYQSFMKHYGGLRDWYFHGYLPVIKSRFTLYIPPRLEFTYRISKSVNYPVIVKQDIKTAQVYFEMNNIPGLDDEPYMDAREDYLQKVIFQLSAYNRDDGFGKQKSMTTWDEVTKQLLNDSDFGVQLNKNIPGSKDFIDGIKNLPEEEKMKVVYTYVLSKMRWNGIYSKYAREGLKTPWSKQEGTSGEINIILINLLLETGLEVYPVLVSERFHGKVDTKYPFIDQFNNVFACVIINNKKYYLDATDKSTPAHIIPKHILNTTAFIVNKKNGGLTTIANDDLLFKEYISSQLTLDNNGKVSGDVYIKSNGYARIEKVDAFKKAGQEKFIDRFYKQDNSVVSSFEFLNKDIDSLPAEQKFTINYTLPKTGDYIYLPVNNYFGFEKNPFINENRYSNVNFGYKKSISTNSTITLPKDYMLDAVPKPVKMTTPDKDILFTRNIVYDKENNSVLCMFSIEFKKSLYSLDEYFILQQVYKKMFEFLKEPLVIKKQ